VIGLLDAAADKVFTEGVGETVQLVDPKKEWADATMTFSVTAKLGFIAVPVSGTLAVDDEGVTADCELPAMARNFLGDEKIRKAITERISDIIA
jgi:hypothetical protein